jgi:hypothetical protein
MRQVQGKRSPAVSVRRLISFESLSKFINSASESSFAIGDGFESCTQGIQLSTPIQLTGRKVILIDTPGYDSTKSDLEVLLMILQIFEKR